MNALKNILTMAWKDLKVLFKDRGQLAVIFVMPLLFSLIFGGMSALSSDSEGPSGEPKLVITAYLVNEDEGPYGAQVEEVLRGIRSLRLYGSRTVAAADEKIAEGEAPAAIIFPADFSAKIDANEPTRVRLIKDPTHQVEAQAVAGILNEVLTELSVRAEIEYGIRAVYEKAGILKGADPEVFRAVQAQTMGTIWTGVQEIRQNPAIAVQSEDLEGEVTQLTVGAIASSAYTPMFCTMFAFFLIGNMAASLVAEREAGSFRRLFAAPIHRGTIIAGKFLAFVVVVFLQMLLLFGVNNALFGMPLGESPLALAALTLALALASTGLGMLLGSVVRTSKEAGNIGMVVGFLLYFASGYTSISISPTGLVSRLEGFRLYLSQLTPFAHSMEGYVKVLLGGADVVDILPNILVLLGFAVVFMLVGLWRFKFE